MGLTIKNPRSDEANKPTSRYRLLEGILEMEYQQLRDQQLAEAKELLTKMNKEQAIYFCNRLAEKLPNINETPPIHRMAEDKYQQFWRFGVVSALNAL